MTKTLISINPALVAFVPRQVLLANPNMKHLKATSDDCVSEEKSLSLKLEQRALLSNYVAQYLERNGFSKTLKKFLSEAQIEKDRFKDSPLELEEIYHKYLDTCNLGSANAVVKSAAVVKCSDSKNSEEVVTDDAEKSKKKKKSKKTSDTPGQETEQVNLKVLKEPTICETVLGESDKRGKDKKKKKSKLVSDSHSLEHHQLVTADDKSVTNPELDNETKDKKKEKSKAALSVHDEIKPEAVTANNGEIEKDAVKSIRNKKKKDVTAADNLNVEDSKEIDVEKSNGTDSKEDNLLVDVNNRENIGTKKRKRSDSEENASQKTSVGDLDGFANEKLDKSGENPSSQKPAKKRRDGSHEPTSIKAFQRVKVEEVEFKDKRLQDNSYWAKDGAEIGYGAKAQEILGQVRGRGFRHEKTKKKRGSYRGGQIDQQTHSVKFNYSDEE